VFVRSLSAFALISILQPAASQRPDAAGYTLLSRDGRRPIAVRTVGNVEMVTLDEIATLLNVTVREDAAAGGIALTMPSGQTVVLSAKQALASIGGRVVSLPAAPVREGKTWLVPIDVIGRAIAPAYVTKLELRKPSRLVIVGDLRVPQVTARHETVGAAARVTFDVQPAAPHSISQETGRLLIRFEAAALDTQLPVTVGRDLVSAIRQGDGPALIVIELGPKFASFKSSDLPGERDGVRFVIDLFGAAGTTIETAPQPVEPLPLPQFKPTGPLHTIVIDPGHGGDELGATGPGGTLEKDVALSVARRLKAAIEGKFGIRTLLTRDADRTIGLDERAAVANNNKADLFISLHANASVRPSSAGAEVFYLSLTEYGEEAERIARGESESLPVFGGGTREIEVILWEMAQARHIERSAEFATLVEAALRQRVPMSPHAIQQAPFRVLVGANMPAVLIEMGFLTNAVEERALSAAERQNAIVQALVDAVVKFREARQ
jgi:N-acetylmuramoyl-L-alanine amidase